VAAQRVGWGEGSSATRGRKMTARKAIRLVQGDPVENQTRGSPGRLCAPGSKKQEKRPTPRRR
jgi:hypothetical protein